MIAEYFLKGLLIGLVFGVPAGYERNIGFLLFSAFTAAILNPATILSFMVAFTVFGISGDLNVYQGISLTAGILTGTLCWWSALSSVVAHFRKKVTNHIYKWLNRILGCLMTLFGIVMIFQAL